jgi:DNA-binding NarL/FixJ family response regulator
MRLGLERDLVVVGEASDGLEALALAGLLRPDVVIMDVEMSEMDGLTATQHLVTAMPEVPVVMLTIHSGVEAHRQAMAAGAAAFVEKRGGAATLLDEIRRVTQHRPNCQGGRPADQV